MISIGNRDKIIPKRCLIFPVEGWTSRCRSRERTDHLLRSGIAVPADQHRPGATRHNEREQRGRAKTPPPLFLPTYSPIRQSIACWKEHKRTFWKTVGRMLKNDLF